MTRLRVCLKAWRNFEEEHGTEETLQQVKKMMPKRVKRRRKIVTDDGVSRAAKQMAYLRLRDAFLCPDVFSSDGSSSSQCVWCWISTVGIIYNGFVVTVQLAEDNQIAVWVKIGQIAAPHIQLSVDR